MPFPVLYTYIVIFQKATRNDSPMLTAFHTINLTFFWLLLSFLRFFFVNMYMQTFQLRQKPLSVPMSILLHQQRLLLCSRNVCTYMYKSTNKMKNKDRQNSHQKWKKLLQQSINWQVHSAQSWNLHNLHVMHNLGIHGVHWEIRT